MLGPDPVSHGMDLDRLASLQPRFHGQTGLYEVWYLKANLVDADASAWLRYTVSSGPVADDVAELWAIVDRGGKVAAGKATWPLQALSLEDEPFSVKLPGGHLDADGCHGSVDRIDWDLAWEPEGRPFWHLPRWAYRLPAPKSKVVTPFPDLAVTGDLTLGGQTLTLDGVPGQMGHVWGSKHADAWAWAHSNRTDGLTWEALTAQPPVGPWTSPPVTVVLVRHQGRTIAFRNPLRTDGSFELGRYRFEGTRGGFRVTGEVTSQDRVAVTYTDPDGEQSVCHNTKRATSVLRLWEDGLLVGSWRDEGATAFEVGDRTVLAGTQVVL